MPHPPPDFLDALDRALAEARREVAAAVDRADALRELRSLALAAAGRHRRLLHGLADLYAEEDEDARARVAALAARISPE